MRSLPSSSRSRAASRCAHRTSPCCSRAAPMAASFSRLASSAPVLPGVRRARRPRSTSPCRGMPRRPTCSRRMSSRPEALGGLTLTIRSKRPGRLSASSRSSGRLVAAMTTTPCSGSKPSISTSNWLSVRSSSLCERLRPRLPPSASISSMKITPPRLRAFLNSDLMRLAPMPTRKPVTSDPETEKKGTPASPATARASSVFPVPGGPTSSAPLGMRAPSRANRSGARRKSTISRSSSAAPCVPATSSKVTSDFPVPPSSAFDPPGRICR